MVKHTWLGWGLWSPRQSKTLDFALSARWELRIGAAGRTRLFHLHPNGHFSFDTAFDARWISAAGSEVLKRETLKDDGESESARPDHAPDDHPFHSNPTPITCARRRSTVAAYLVDLVMAVGTTRKSWADLRSRCEVRARRDLPGAPGHSAF